MKSVALHASDTCLIYAHTMNRAATNTSRDEQCTMQTPWPRSHHNHFDEAAASIRAEDASEKEQKTHIVAKL